MYLLLMFVQFFLRDKLEYLGWAVILRTPETSFVMVIVLLASSYRIEALVEKVGASWALELILAIKGTWLLHFVMVQMAGHGSVFDSCLILCQTKC